MTKKALPLNPAIIFINGIMLSGKSTLARDLKELIEQRRHSKKDEYFYHECVICDTGDESKRRLATNSGSPLNEAIARIRANGSLQPVLATANVLYSFFDEHLLQTKDIIVCGSPRSPIEAELLINFFKAIQGSFEVKRSFFSISLNVSEEEFTQRLMIRSKMEQRPDDLTRRSVQERIHTHNTVTNTAVNNLNYELRIPQENQILIASNESTKFAAFEMIENKLF